VIALNLQDVVRRVAIRSRDKLDVKIYDTRGCDERWNLAVLRSPEHIDAVQDLEMMKGVKFVTLDFDTIEKQEGIQSDF
jgi:hypothetical protein